MKFRLNLLAVAVVLAFPAMQSHANSAQQIAKETTITTAQEIAETTTQPNDTKQKNSTKKKKFNWAFWRKDDPNPTDELPMDAEANTVYEPTHPVEIRVNNEDIKKLLNEHLPLISYQRKEKLDDEQLGYLAEDAPSDAKNLLRTEGYFNATVTVSPKDKGYVVDVNLGKRTTINNVNVAIVGDILTDENLGKYYNSATQNWKLPVGANFRQEDWANSKTAALAAITRKKYPLAKLSQTQATIDPNTQTADLSVSITSNRPIYFGDFQITGNARYPASIITGAANFQAGDTYDLDQLLDYQQALENNSHYSGASVQADFDNIQGNRVPIKVSVSEAKRQKIEAGIRFDSEYGLGGNVRYDHYNVFNRGYVGSTVFDMDKYQTTFGAGISQPRDNKGRYLTSNATYNRSTTQNLEKRSLSTGIWHVRERPNNEWRFGVEFVAENSRIPNSKIQLGKSHATMLTAAWKHQKIETQMRPANGYYVDTKIGTTLGSLLSSAMMARAYGSAGYYFTPENKQLGTFVTRGNIGYVYTNEKEAAGQVPTSLMFRTGGANTVRGYELDSIGRQAPDTNAILPDRAMVAASAEYQYPIKQDFALAVFHDVGGVARNFSSMKWKRGTGLGVRWYSPVAPFSFDLAYGHQDKRVRWHINLGTRF